MGDGITHSVGKWELKGQKILLEYHLVWEDFPPVNQENAPHPTIREESYYDGQKIILGKITCLPVKNVEDFKTNSFYSCPPTTEREENNSIE